MKAIIETIFIIFLFPFIIAGFIACVAYAGLQVGWRCGDNFLDDVCRK